MKAAWIVLVVACGGGPDPILRNVPQPNPAVVAGAAAAIAGAATLADPQAAAARQEKNKEAGEKRPVTVKQTVPSDVLDRAERQDPRAAPDGQNASVAPSP